MTDLDTRSELNVDLSGEHHRWIGAFDPRRRTGRIKIRGKAVTADRVAWELANGQLPPTVRAVACPEDLACVRVDRLRLKGDGTPRQRSPI